MKITAIAVLIYSEKLPEEYLDFIEKFFNFTSFIMTITVAVKIVKERNRFTASVTSQFTSVPGP